MKTFLTQRTRWEIIVLDCGGKRSVTPLSNGYLAAEGGVAAALCHRSPKTLCGLGEFCLWKKT
jgi:hypothetical protein